MGCGWSVARNGARTLAAAFAASLCLASTASAQSPPEANASVSRGLPITVADAPAPSWAQPVRPALGSPNIIVILTDDVGFGATSTFGGPIPTPVADSLSNDGVRYNRFHTTGICSPTRAALLTGRNHHRTEVGNVIGFDTGYDGYRGIIPPSTGTIAEVLRHAGYGTAMFGKAHFTPSWETGPAGPFDRWPTGLGFQYFYGFLPGDTNQWAPALYENTIALPSHGERDFTLDQDLADRAISWIRQRRGTDPGRPLFIYFAPGTAHAPHHAPRAWIDRFAGQFDIGWDAIREQTLQRQRRLGIVPRSTRLSPRPDEIPAWSSLSVTQQRVYARQMEAYAGALAFADHQIGRVIEELRAQDPDNLLVIYVQGDNGASAEGTANGLINEGSVLNGVPEDFERDLVARLDEMGGPRANNHYSYGWANAMNTPFPWFKQHASHLGGTRNGLVISWPARNRARGAVRAQFHHVIDIFPTIVEAAGLEAPQTLNGVAQQPIDGISMLYTFARANPAERRREQYFLMWDNMALYRDGWLASSRPETMPWFITNPRPTRVLDREWELYNLDDDFSQSRNLAAADPARLQRMAQDFFAVAAQNNALPIHRLEGVEGRPTLFAGMNNIRLTPDSSGMPEFAAPSVRNRSYTLRADVDLAAEHASGMLITQGGRFGGWGFYLDRGHLVFAYNLADLERYEIRSSALVGRGARQLEATFAYDGDGLGKGGVITLRVDGREVGSGRIAQTLRRRHSIDETMDVGCDTGTPVSDAYRVPFCIEGALRHVDIELR